MKLKLLALTALAGVLAIGLVTTLSKSQKMVPRENGIEWHIKEAKNQGIKKVSVPARTADYLGSADQDIQKALSTYTVVVAEPIESRTFQHTSNNLITWCKFRTLEAVSGVKTPPCLECNSLSAPTEMLPLFPGEFLVPRQGGTIERDGVEFSEVDESFPPFQAGQKYLMLLLLYPSGIALTAGGPVGVFQLGDNEKV